MFGEQIDYFLLESLLFPAAGAVVLCGSTITINDLVLTTLIQHLQNEIINIDAQLVTLKVQINALNEPIKDLWQSYRDQLLPGCNHMVKDFPRGFAANVIANQSVHQGPIIFLETFQKSQEYVDLYGRLDKLSAAIEELEKLRNQHNNTIASCKWTKDFYHSPKSYLILLILGAALGLLIALRLNGKI
jgi:hypothetical protein